jgi:hypothetical protein
MRNAECGRRAKTLRYNAVTQFCIPYSAFVSPWRFGLLGGRLIQRRNAHPLRGHLLMATGACHDSCGSLFSFRACPRRQHCPAHMEETWRSMTWSKWME